MQDGKLHKIRDKKLGFFGGFVILKKCNRCGIMKSRAVPAKDRATKKTPRINHPRSQTFRPSKWGRYQ